jgi:two-component system, OmpR family, response regulator
MAAPRLETQPVRRILVADDDGDMRELIARSLRRDGFDVELVRGGPELLSRLSATSDPHRALDLLITDVQMPGVSGVDVLTWMRTHGWRQPVILVTAYPHPALAEQADTLGGASVVAKPFELRQLTVLVRQTLDGRS